MEKFKKNKLDADHSNDTKPYITETYSNGSSGYRKWSDGYCEQWGRMLKTAAVGTGRYDVGLLVPYKDIEYFLKLTLQYDKDHIPDGNIIENHSNRTITSFSVLTGYANNGASGYSSYPFIWKVTGYV